MGFYDTPDYSTKYLQNTLSQGGLQPQWQALQDISNDSFVCYQDLSEYVGLENI